MSIQDELEAIMNAGNGLLKPSEALEWARAHPKSALYSQIEWDRDKAAYEHQIWQIRRLIAIHIITPERARQTISLSIDRVRPGGGYRDVDGVMQDVSLRAVALADALRDLERIRARYTHLHELARIWDELDKVKARAEARRSSSIFGRDNDHDHTGR